MLTVPPSPVLGQTFLPDPVEQVAFALQLEKPFLAGATGLAAFSSILEADALLPVGFASLQIGLPVAFAGADFVDGTSVYMGNVRASLLFGAPDALTSFIGVTLPTASNISGPDLALLVGVLPWLGELEKWVDDNITVSGAILPSWRLSDAGRIGLRLGGAAFVATGFENLNVDARVAGWVRVPTATAALRAEVATSYMVTSDDGFGDQFTAYLDLGVSLTGVSAQPGLFLRVPLDGDGRQVHDLSLGVSVRF
jgi:hypothetical protein